MTSVARGSPAQSAGLEVGDVLVAINEAEIRSADELTALAALGEAFSLDVVDVNSGRIARIQIDPSSVDSHTNNSDVPEGKPADTRAANRFAWHVCRVRHTGNAQCD